MLYDVFDNDNDTEELETNVNVSDVTEKSPNTGDRLEAVFRYQAELKNKYSDIERRSGIGLGLLPEVFDLDHPKCQYVLKDYAWRVTEEIGEALAAEEKIHRWEEIADGLHFLTELCHLAGIGPEDVMHKIDGEDRLATVFDKCEYSGMDRAVGQFVRSMGMAMNSLKQKPWKQTHFPTDEVEFRSRLARSYIWYVGIAISCHMTAEDLFDMYFKKSRVNHFRTRSNY